MATDPHADRGVSVTIKTPESKRYAADNPWVVFHGSVESVKEDLGKAFDIETEGLSLYSVTVNAQRIASGIGTASNVLGGTVVKEEKADATPTPANSPAPAKSEPEKDKVLEALALAQSVADVQQVWAEYGPEFTDEHMAAYKARGRELSK